MLEFPRNNVLITSYIVAAGVQLNHYLTATISHFLEKDARKKSSEFRPQMFLTELGSDKTQFANLTLDWYHLLDINLI